MSTPLAYWYSVMAAEDWVTSRSFSKLATQTASTKRPPALSGGKRGEPVQNVASLVCTPLDPVDAEIRHRVAIQTPHELLQTFVQASVDVVVGDILVVGGVEYPVRACGDWQWPGDSTTYRHLIVEDLKR